MNLVNDAQQQEKVNAYFQSMSSYWKEVYSSGTVPGKIYGERQAAVLDWIESLDLKPGSRVLEIGCGAGRLSHVLAEDFAPNVDSAFTPSTPQRP